MSSCLQLKLKVIHNVNFFIIKKPKKLGSLTYGTCKKNHRIRFLMQLYASRNICFLYIITFLDSLLEGLQEFPTLKQFISLDIGLKCILSDYNKGHIIRELRTRDCTAMLSLQVFGSLPCSVENRMHFL
jgi:hypothetical protein